MKFFNLVLVTTIATTSLCVSAKALPSRMPKSCEVALLQSEEIKYGSVQSSSLDIVASLKYLWKSSGATPTITYDECGSSDFYNVEVDKATCTILNVSIGDSDGECGIDQ